MQMTGGDTFNIGRSPAPSLLSRKVRGKRTKRAGGKSPKSDPISRAAGRAGNTKGKSHFGAEGTRIIQVSSVDPRRHAKRLYVLAVLYYATKGRENWIRTDGFLGEDSVCRWYGIGCDGSGSAFAITSVDIGTNNQKQKMLALD